MSAKVPLYFHVVLWGARAANSILFKVYNLCKSRCSFAVFSFFLVCKLLLTLRPPSRSKLLLIPQQIKSVNYLKWIWMVRFSARIESRKKGSSINGFITGDSFVWVYSSDKRIKKPGSYCPKTTLFGWRFYWLLVEPRGHLSIPFGNDAVMTERISIR